MRRIARQHSACQAHINCPATVAAPGIPNPMADSTTCNASAARRHEAFAARIARRHAAVSHGTSAASVAAKLARAAEARAAAMNEKLTSARADLRHVRAVKAAQEYDRSNAAVDLDRKLETAAAERATRLFRKRERVVSECQHAKDVARRTREARSHFSASAMRLLARRLRRAELRRAEVLAHRTRSAQVSNHRVRMAAARRRHLYSGSDSDGDGDSCCADMSVDSSGGSSAVMACVSPGSESDACGAASPPRQRRRMMARGFTLDAADGDAAPTPTPKTPWYDTAASPRRAGRKAWRRAQQKLWRAEARRAQRQRQHTEELRRRDETAAARVSKCKAAQEEAQRQARARLEQSLHAAAQRRDAQLASMVKRARSHSEDVAERAHRVREAKSVLSSFVKKAKTAAKPAEPAPKPEAAQPRAATQAPPASAGAGAGAGAAPAANPSATAERAVQDLVRGKTIRSMMATLHRVASRSAPGVADNERLSFERCSRAMQSKKVMLAFRGVAAVTTTVVEDILADQVPHVSSRPAVQRSARTLSAAILIGHYPAEMFGKDALADDASPESKLVMAARRVVAPMLLMGAMAHEDRVQPVALTLVIFRSLHAAWLEFMDAFARWKGKDGKQLAAQMMPGFIQLELTRRMYAQQLDDLKADASSSDDEAQLQLEATQQLLAGVGSHLGVMRKQLTNLLGQQGALEWEREAVRKLDDELGDGALPSPPRVTFRRAAGASGRSDSTDSADTTSSGASNAERVRVAPSSTLNSDQATGSPPRKHKRRQGGARQMRNLMSNVALVHKLMLDPSYRFKGVEEPKCLQLDGGVWDDAASDAPACHCASHGATTYCARAWEQKFGAVPDRDELTSSVIAELRVVKTGLANLTPNRQVRTHAACCECCATCISLQRLLCPAGLGGCPLRVAGPPVHRRQPACWDLRGSRVR